MTERLIVKIIKEICYENNISLETFSYNWLLRLSRNDKTMHIFGYSFENNSAASQLVSSDKCATSDLLRFNGIPAVEHFFYMAPTDIRYIDDAGNWKNLIRLLNEYGQLVCKANEGSGGGNVYLARNQFELEKAAHKLFRYSRFMAVCPFYKIKNEFRVIVLNNSIKLIYSKNIPYVEGDGVSTIRQLLISYIQQHIDCTFDLNVPEDVYSNILEDGEKYFLNWKHNLGQGATPLIVEDKTVIEELSDLALRAAKAINVCFASIDIIKTEDNYLILEINSGIMMENFSQINDNNYQIAKNIYKEAIESLF